MWIKERVAPASKLATIFVSAFIIGAGFCWLVVMAVTASFHPLSLPLWPTVRGVLACWSGLFVLFLLMFRG